MNNIEKLNGIFTDVFSVDASVLNSDFINTNVETWDSIHHLSLTAAIEEAFDLLLDTEDVIEMTSYDKCKEILSDKYGISF